MVSCRSERLLFRTIESSDRSFKITRAWGRSNFVGGRQPERGVATANSIRPNTSFNPEQSRANKHWELCDGMRNENTRCWSVTRQQQPDNCWKRRNIENLVDIDPDLQLFFLSR